MNITVPIHEIISWLVTVVAVTLYLMERRKNVTAPCYMALRGILRSCLERKGHFALLAKNLQEDKREEILRQVVWIPRLKFLVEYFFSHLQLNINLLKFCYLLVNMGILN